MDVKDMLPIYDAEVIGVYAIHNKKNNKFYIGSSTNVKKRQEVHKTKMMRLDAINSKIKEDLKSFYDLENFEFLILEIFPDNTITGEQLREKEAFYIKKYNAYNGYNINPPWATKLSQNNRLLECKKEKVSSNIPILENQSNLELLDYLLHFSKEIEKRNLDAPGLVTIIKYNILLRMANGTEK